MKRMDRETYCRELERRRRINGSQSEQRHLVRLRTILNQKTRPVKPVAPVKKYS